MPNKNKPSTPVDELHKQRLKREVQRAAERGKAQHRTLQAKGKESHASHGHALLQAYAETIGISLDALLTRLLENPHLAGRHHAAWPLLLHFCDRGPRCIIAVTLGVVIDTISQRPERNKLATKIGTALQDELKATRIHQQRGQVLLAAIKKKLKRKTVSRDVMAQLRVDPSGWTKPEKRELGLLLLELIEANTDLITTTTKPKPQVLASEAAVELMRLNPPRPLPIRALPSLLPPEPWTDVMRGTKRLVSSRQPMDLSHITAKSVAQQIEVVNAIEQQQLVMDPWMVDLQRQAWDADLPVFPVRRDPTNRWTGGFDAGERARIEDTISQAEEVAGLPIWLEHDFDFRGRLYCSSRVGGHQGPDHQKALISFARRDLVDDEGFEGMLAAAAGHWGLGRASWAERRQWGRDHIDVLLAVADTPLDVLHLWRDCSDPWQFVQLAKAVATYLRGDLSSGVPIRFDQTCSGMGIIAALTRDKLLARHTNLTGSTRHDLYGVVASELTRLLEADLHGYDFREIRMAELWLKHGITRELCKGPTMTTVYGAKHFGITEGLVAVLQEANPNLPVALWQRDYTGPAQYLARKFALVIGSQLKSCIELEKWIKEVSRRCMKAQQRIQWVSPLGFPIALGSLVDERQRVNTVLHGARKWQRVDAFSEPGELSAKATNRGVMANTIHTFDAAMCHAVVLTGAGIGMPLLTNHDCFATTPTHAATLHQLLMGELRMLYRPDWLAEMRVEISRNAGVDLPHPPYVGDLGEGEIGQNPYCFS